MIDRLVRAAQARLAQLRAVPVGCAHGEHTCVTKEG
jgi:hypothetical protein